MDATVHHQGWQCLSSIYKFRKTTAQDRSPGSHQGIPVKELSIEIHLVQRESKRNNDHAVSACFTFFFSNSHSTLYSNDISI